MPNLDVCGTIYPYPNVGDNPWGVPHIDWATAVSACLTTLNTQVNTTTMPNVFTTSGDMVYANPAVVPTRLGIGAIGQVLTVAGSGLPAWQAPAAGSVSAPIGSIIAWNDFNGLLALDANFRYCDGSVIVAVGSPIDGQTTDDLSGAYIVGYGTLGAGDIGTAPYDATPTGNANHQINLTHTHIISGTAIDGLLATSNGLTGTIRTDQVSNSSSGFGTVDDIKIIVDSSGATVNTLRFQTAAGVNNGEGQHRHEMPSLSHNHTVTGSGTTNTGSGLSSTQSIQPRSQRYRMIIRVL
jgi:hypothetical protein